MGPNRDPPEYSPLLLLSSLLAWAVEAAPSISAAAATAIVVFINMISNLQVC
jgi:hypothetical protein